MKKTQPRGVCLKSLDLHSSQEGCVHKLELTLSYPRSWRGHTPMHYKAALLGRRFVCVLRTHPCVQCTGNNWSYICRLAPVYRSS
jgi:hypothetical protein